MEIVEREGFKAVGLQVLAEWEQLYSKMPQKWKAFKKRLHEIRHRKDDIMMDISRSEEGGVYVQLICVKVEEFDEIPTGMTTLSLPAQKYIYHRHEDDIEEITAAFGSMYEWAENEGVNAGVFKIDYGYLPDGSEDHHELYIKIEE